MSQIFDLFGDPVPANHGRRGRPQHIPTHENRCKVNMLLAFGWSNERIAASLRITPPSLRKHYFSELKYREVARDRLNAKLAMTLMAQGEAGNVGAIRELRKLIQDNDLMAPSVVPDDKPVKLGKKDAAVLAAHEPDTDSDMGSLIARRQQVFEPPKLN